MTPQEYFNRNSGRGSYRIWYRNFQRLFLKAKPSESKNESLCIATFVLCPAVCGRMGVFLLDNLGHKSRGTEKRFSFFDLASLYFVLPFEPIFVCKTPDSYDRNLPSLCFT